MEQLLAVDEIGPSIAGSLLHYFTDPDNLNIVNRLRQHGLHFNITGSLELLSDKLAGMTVVVSGTFSLFPKRDDLKKAIEQHGGKVASSVSSKTDFIVAGENMGPDKRTKATLLSIPIISEEEFIQRIS